MLTYENDWLFSGYRIRAGSGSPVRRRNADHRYSPEFDHPIGMPRGRGFRGGRSGRFRDYSPPYGRGRGRGGRFLGGRGFDGPRFDFGHFRGEGMLPGNSNVRPREGDWICPDPTCANLNFARREHCNNCSRYRYAPIRYPRRGGYFGPPPRGGPRRYPGPPLDRSPPRHMNGYRSPRSWAQEGPRDLDPRGPPNPRYEERIPDQHLRRERMDYPEEDFRERSKFARPLSPDMAQRDRGRDVMYSERKSYERRPPSPRALPSPLPPPRRHWAEDERERSRSPIRGRPPPKEYQREIYEERDRDERRVVGRDRDDEPY